MRVLESSALNAAVQRLVAHLRPTRVYLFGSHAYGTPRAGSDVDLLVVVPRPSLPPHKRDADAYGCLGGCGLPIEVRVYTEEELEWRASVCTSLESTIVKRGRVLYDGEGATGTRMTD